MARSEAKQRYAQEVRSQIERMKNRIAICRQYARDAQEIADKQKEAADNYTQEADNIFQNIIETQEAFADWEAKNPE